MSSIMKGIIDEEVAFDYDALLSMPGKEKQEYFRNNPEIKNLYYAEQKKRIDAVLNNYSWMTPEEKAEYERLAKTDTNNKGMHDKSFAAEKYLKQLFQQKMDAKKAASMLKVHWAPLADLQKYLTGQVSTKTELSAYLAKSPEDLGKVRWGNGTVGIVIDGHITIGGRGDLGSDQYKKVDGVRGQQKYTTRPGQIDPTFDTLDLGKHHEVLVDNWKIREIVLPSDIPENVDAVIKKAGIPVRRLANQAQPVNEEELDENLRKWFKEKWVRFGPDGKIRGACARGDDSEGKPKCLPQKKAQNLGKKGRKYAASKKRREDPNPERRGKAKNVATKKKTNENIPFNECPECRGPIVHESMMNEKQDACYHKVKSRYKVWPSAYASGALVQCRKKGASNWGTGGKKKNESSIMKGIVDEAEAAKLVQISKPVTQDPIDDPWMGINVITKYKVGDKVYSVLSVKELEQEDVYGTYIFDNTDPKNHMDDVAQIDIYGNRAIFNKNHTGAPKDVWYQLPENIAMALHNASFPEAKKLLDAQPMPDEDELYEEESVLVLYIDGKPSAKYAIGHEAKTAMERLQAKFPNRKFELKREMREARVSEAKAKPYVKPFIENGKQVGWKSSDGYHVKYWQMFAKDSAIKHAKLNPDEVQEDYTGEFAAEKTPETNPYGGLKDRQHRGAISETPTDNPTGASGEGGMRKYRPKPAGELDESRMHQYNINDAVKKVQEYHRTQGSPYRGAATRLLNALYQWQNTEDDNIVTRAQLLRTPNMGKQAMALLDTLLGNISKDESPYDQNKNQAIVIVDSLKQALAGDDLQSILDLMRELKNAIGNMDRLSYKRVREDTAYAGGMGQGGNAGQSYRKFKPKSAGTFKEEQLDEKCWDTHKQVGMKNKGGKEVPNCVPKESAIMKGLKR